MPSSSPASEQVRLQPDHSVWEEWGRIDFPPHSASPQFRRDNVGVNPVGALTAVAVKVALGNPGSHQNDERLFLKMD